MGSAHGPVAPTTQQTRPRRAGSEGVQRLLLGCGPRQVLGLRPCHGCTGTSAGFGFVASVTRSSAVWLWASIWRQRRVRMNFLRISGSPRGAVQPRTPPGARQAAVRSGSVADALPSDLLPRHTLRWQAALSSHGPGQIRYRSTS